MNIALAGLSASPVLATSSGKRFELLKENDIHQINLPIQ
ncbi:hypothetical protein AXFE_32720 [Acidithrix ferrooxidans]|uniref:Uncharacterized protein n=1 Tax=Acidithrix ferrooxidans TaxID=1280514 RepID=A0A0D8HD74_9ACTN|nr:hypothetical protein AXFE_32720 [Acidithrix ferrooxidans]CAG4906599.1 unnamed protein product [Acidithrix sp. C25]